MSQSFRLSFDKPLESAGNKTAIQPGAVLQNEYYEQDGYGRNICFVKDDGSKIFLSYGHLITGEYNPDENIILLAFTSHTISLKGVCLEELFYKLMQQLVKQVVCADSRYDIINDEKNAAVYEIVITVKET